MKILQVWDMDIIALFRPFRDSPFSVVIVESMSNIRIEVTLEVCVKHCPEMFGVPHFPTKMVK